MKPVRVLLFAVLIAVSAQAQDARPPQHQGGAPAGARVVTMTRPMAVVSRLENQLEDALVRGDQAALDQLVTGDFSLWTPVPSGEPVPREDWLKQAPRLLPIQRRNLAVESLSNGEVFVASFVALQPGIAKSATVDHFIVDVWTKAGDSYLLAARYQTKVSGYPHAARRPTGKD